MLQKVLFHSWRNYTRSRNEDTIFALATGVNCAVSIVRIGGPKAYRTLELLVNKKAISLRDKLVQLNRIQPRKAHFKSLYDENGKMIDQCILIHFPQQQSYNNQQIFELHLHGSRAVVSCIFRELRSKGFRMADRGQFTKRAILNGKMNVVQAESINDLVKSESQFERQIAINNMLGKSQQFIQGIKDDLLKCLASNQAFIDFQEDQKDVRDDLLQDTKNKVKQIVLKINKIIDNYKNLQIIKQGISLTILGKPNVGKSTLINSLAKKQIAIVSEQPGTTRDILQAQIECAGVLLNLYDTAGLRDTDNRLEAEGIRRAKDKIKQSQIKMLLIDLQQECVKEHKNEFGQSEYEIIVEAKDQFLEYGSVIDERTIIIINKGDKIQMEKKLKSKYFFMIEKLEKLGHSQNVTKVKKNEQFGRKRYEAHLILSAENPAEVEKLFGFLTDRIRKQYSLYHSTQQIYFTRERYFLKLKNCKVLLELYLGEQRPDIMCEYLREGIIQVGEMFGKVDVEDMLDVLFQQFCIGK